MVPTGLAAVLSNILFSLELTPPSIEIWPLRAIYRERGVKTISDNSGVVAYYTSQIELISFL